MGVLRIGAYYLGSVFGPYYLGSVVGPLIFAALLLGVGAPNFFKLAAPEASTASSRLGTRHHTEGRHSSQRERWNGEPKSGQCCEMGYDTADDMKPT